jgi:hypothetical protein
MNPKWESSDLRCYTFQCEIDQAAACATAGKLVEHIECVDSLLGGQPGMGHKTKLPSLKTFPV